MKYIFLSENCTNIDNGFYRHSLSKLAKQKYPKNPNATYDAEAGCYSWPPHSAINVFGTVRSRSLHLTERKTRHRDYFMKAESKRSDRNQAASYQGPRLEFPMNQFIKVPFGSWKESFFPVWGKSPRSFIHHSRRGFDCARSSGLSKPLAEFQTERGFRQVESGS